jgi:hypothetical protein
VHALEREQVLAYPLGEVFAFFADALNLEAITPPWLHFEVLTPGPIEMRAGALIAYRMRLRGAPVQWLTQIEAWEPQTRFVDTQLRGPYRLWHHTHTFEACREGTLMRDRVRYELPLGPLGGIAHFAFIGTELARIFDYRSATIGRLLA